MRITKSQLRQVIRGILQEHKQQTLTPEFRSWFGRSMMVDPAGNPIKLYHGTRGTFDVFNLGEFGKYGPGIYLSASRDNAGGFATGRHRGHDADGGSSVMPLYVRLVNPLILIESDAGPRINTISGELTPGHEALQEKLSTLSSAVEYMGGRGNEFSREVRSLGHDGIIVDLSGYLEDPAVAADMVSSGITREELAMAEVIIFDPRQLKSALGNTGTYDPEDPSIVTETQLRHVIREAMINEQDAQQVKYTGIVLSPTTTANLRARIYKSGLAGTIPGWVTSNIATDHGNEQLNHHMTLVPGALSPDSPLRALLGESVPLEVTGWGWDDTLGVAAWRVKIPSSTGIVTKTGNPHITAALKDPTVKPFLASRIKAWQKEFKEPFVIEGRVEEVRAVLSDREA